MTQTAALLQSTDWTATPLGPIERWPRSLRVAVDICLNSRFPMFVWWGPELINIYNDAYVPMLGKRHPQAFGKPAQPTWHEIWDVVGPQADAVMQRGEATWNERVLLVMERHGYSENTYFTWSYSPIIDENGAIGGLYCACFEETPRIAAERERDRAVEALRSSDQRYRTFIQLSSEGIWRFELDEPIPVDLPEDEQIERMFRHAYLAECNDAMARMYGYESASAMIGRRLNAFHDPNVEMSLEFLRAFIRGGYRLTDAESREPDREGKIKIFLNSFAGWLENGKLVRAWGTQRDVTQQRDAEVAVQAGAQQMRLLTDALPALISYVGADQRYQFNNRTYGEWFGLEPAAIRGQHLRELLGDERYRERLPYIERALRGETVRFDCLTRHCQKGLVQTELMYVPDIEADGRVAGFVVLVQDVSEKRRAEMRDSFLLALDDAIRPLEDADQITATCARLLAEHLHADRCAYAEIDAEGQSFTLTGDYNRGVPSIVGRYRLGDFGQEFADLARRGKPYVVNDVETHRPEIKDLAPYRQTLIRAMIAVPLHKGGRLVAGMAVQQRTPRTWTSDEVDLVQHVAQRCWESIERARVERQRTMLLAAERAARADLERASRAKDEFLATLSHELRTPLTPVLLTVSLLESSPVLPESLRGDVRAIRQNVELESRLISDLLDLTRIAKGKLQLDEQDVDLHLILRSAIDICQREASAKLTTELHATRHIVRGDSTRLQQIFWNLINNAIKFTGTDGSIIVRSSDAEDDRIHVEVIDTGVGIDAEVIPRLFNAFEQGEIRAARQQAGLGLGLAISRKLVEAHRGTIDAFSEGRGRGATFTVELPVVSVFVPEAPAIRPAPAMSDARKLAVLLIEDHEPTLKVLSRLLSQLGHRVTGVKTVASATAAAAQDGFDVIISDLGLPDGSGLDIMRRLRDDYAGRAIALTGYGMDADIAASKEAGFAEHLTKPVDLAALESAIRRVIPAGSV